MTGATRPSTEIIVLGGKLNYFVLSNGLLKLSSNYLFTPMD